MNMKLAYHKDRKQETASFTLSKVMLTKSNTTKYTISEQTYNVKTTLVQFTHI